MGFRVVGEYDEDEDEEAEENEGSKGQSLCVRASQVSVSSEMFGGY